ncbi:hypothetical protein [Undibacterium sp. WLX3042]
MFNLLFLEKGQSNNQAINALMPYGTASMVLRFSAAVMQGNQTAYTSS